MEIYINDDIIVSKTDLQGRITYGNKYFIDISGYTEKELLNAPHNILRNNEMPKIIFQLLWDRIKNGEHINAYVKNNTKAGDYYWVFASVTASLNKNNQVVGYHSVRRKPSSQSLAVINKLYSDLLLAENRGGITASAKLLEDILEEKGVNYDEFIVTIQK